MTTRPSVGPSVVITGIGSVSALGVKGGLGLAAAVAAGGPAIRPIRAFATDTLRSRLGGEVEDLSGHLSPDEARRLPRVSQLTLVAARKALADAGLEAGGTPGLGLVLGSHWGDFRSSETFARGYLSRGPLGLSPLVFPSTVMNAMASHTSIALGARGPMLTLNQPGGAGEAAVARAAAFIASGRAPAVLAGGVDELSPDLFQELARLGITSPADPGPEGCRPFDRRADGTVLGEGATFVLLEAQPSAQARGARAYARIEASAAGLAGRPGRRPTRRPDPAVIRTALTLAGRRPEDLGAAYLTGLGVAPTDRYELELLVACCAPAAIPPITALTPLVGDHGGLGVLRVVAAAAVTLQGRGVPPLPDLVEPIWTEPTPGPPVRSGRPATRVPAASRDGRPPAVLVHGLSQGGLEVALVLGADGLERAA